MAHAANRFTEFLYGIFRMLGMTTASVVATAASVTAGRTDNDGIRDS
jgi:hypothetical protein